MPLKEVTFEEKKIFYDAVKSITLTNTVGNNGKIFYNRLLEKACYF